MDRHLKKQFPLVLVDAPCSGLGVLRRRPDSRWRKSRKGSGTGGVAGKILDSVYRLLAPGGKVVYSTCTIEPQENYQVVEAFCRNTAICGELI